MYLEYYGFTDKPFRLNHDPAYYYGEAHQVPLNELCYSIEERHGLAILLGEAGTGKTTLLLRLVRSFADNLQGVFLSDMAVNDASLLRQVARALRIPFKPQDPTEVVTQYLDIFLRGRATEGKTVVVLLDEAQSLSKDQFDEIRFLTNLEHRGQRLVEIVLAGLPSLERRLTDPDLEAVNQRATVRCWVEPFSRDQVTAYVKHRLEVVNAPNMELFGEQALDRVYMASRGIPRLINILCERALLVGYVEETHDLNESLVEQAISDLRMQAPEQTQNNTGALSLESNLLVRMADQMDAMKKQLDRMEASLAPHPAAGRPSVQSLQAAEMAHAVRRRTQPTPGAVSPAPTARPTNGQRSPSAPRPQTIQPATAKPAPANSNGHGTRTHGASPRIERRPVTKPAGPVPLTPPEQRRVSQWLKSVKNDQSLSDDPGQKTVEIVPAEPPRPSLAQPNKRNTPSRTARPAPRSDEKSTVVDDLVEDMDVVTFDSADGKLNRW